MAMNAQVLGAAIKLAIDAKVAAATGADPPTVPTRDSLFEAMAQAIITHLQTSAVVTVASVSGVTAGPGVSGPGAGTLS